MLSLRVSRPITRGPVNVDIAAGAAAADFFDFRSVPPSVGGGGGIGRSGRFFPSTPVLAARADNDDDDDGRIIVEETWEKTRRGRRASIIAPLPRDGGRYAYVLRRDMVGDGGGAFGFLVWRIIGVHGLGR